MVDGNLPTFFTSLSVETLHIWSTSTADTLSRPLLPSLIILMCHRFFAYLSFQSVMGTTIWTGNAPRESELTTMAGRVLLISEPFVGSKLTSQTSPREAILIINNLSGLQVVFRFSLLVMIFYSLSMLCHYLPALLYGQLQEGLTFDQGGGVLYPNGFT